MGTRLDSCWFLSILLGALLRSTESKTLRNISRSKSVLAPKSRSNSWPLQPTCRNALWSKIWVVDPIAPFSWCYVCVCVSWHLKLQDVVVLQRTIRLHELLQVVFSIRTPFWILVDIGATGFDVFFDVFCIFCPHTSESSATMCHPNQSQTHQSLSSMLMRPSAFASAFAKAVAIWRLSAAEAVREMRP